MTILRIGSTQKFADNWAQAFGSASQNKGDKSRGSKAAQAVGQAAPKKKKSPKKQAKKPTTGGTRAAKRSAGTKQATAKKKSGGKKR